MGKGLFSFSLTHTNGAVFSNTDVQDTLHALVAVENVTVSYEDVKSDITSVVADTEQSGNTIMASESIKEDGESPEQQVKTKACIINVSTSPEETTTSAETTSAKTIIMDGITLNNKFAPLAGGSDRDVQFNIHGNGVKDTIWFKRENCELSTLYTHNKCKGPCNINVFGRCWLTTEEAYKWKCTDYHDDNIRKIQIERAKDPRIAMKIGAEIVTGQAWHEDKKDIMKQCLIAKFNGCDGYR